MTISIEDMATFCRKKGFVYPSSEIYGGISGFWDFGPLGVELFNNIKQSWWKYFVHNNEDAYFFPNSIYFSDFLWEDVSL